MPNKAGLIALAQHRTRTAVINTHLCPVRRILLLWHSTEPLLLLSTLIYAQ